MSVVWKTSCLLLQMKCEGHIPRKLWQQPESAIVTEYFEEVTAATEIKTAPVWTADKYRCLKCFCTRTQTDSQLKMKTTLQLGNNQHKCAT